MPRPKRNPEPCTAAECDRLIRYWSTGFCNVHHQRSLHPGRYTPVECSVDGCDVVLSHNNSKGRCAKHTYVLKTWGTCGATGCSRRVRSDNASGLCATHLRIQKCAEWQSERRARHANLYVEDVDRGVLLAAHSGICHLCSTAVGPDWQVEHVIPVSKGGPHCYGNTAPSHPSCNYRKSHFTVGSPDPSVDAAARAAYEAFHGRPF